LVWRSWFTVAKGITSEVFYPSLDVPNMEDMQYVITDGSTFVDLECDATSHAISMPTENALEYTVTNTDTRTSPKYRITNTYITDQSRDKPLIRTRLESLDGGRLPALPARKPKHGRWRRKQRRSSRRLRSEVRTASSGMTTAMRRWRATVMSNCISTWRSSTDSTAQATTMLCSAGDRQCRRPIRRSRSRSGMAATWRRPSPRWRDRLRPDFRIGTAPTAKAGATIGRAASCQRVDGHAAPAGLLRSGDGPARRRRQDIPRRQRRGVWHALRRFRQRRPAETSAC
jgi:Glucodextranase, domain N